MSKPVNRQSRYWVDLEKQFRTAARICYSHMLIVSDDPYVTQYYIELQQSSADVILLDPFKTTVDHFLNNQHKVWVVLQAAMLSKEEKILLRSSATENTKIIFVVPTLHPDDIEQLPNTSDKLEPLIVNANISYDTLSTVLKNTPEPALTVYRILRLIYKSSVNTVSLLWRYYITSFGGILARLF